MVNKMKRKYSRQRGKFNKFEDGGDIGTPDAGGGSEGGEDDGSEGDENDKEGLWDFLKSNAGTIINAAAGSLGEAAGKGISNGKRSAPGNIINGIGDAVGSVPVVGGIAKGALNIVGGGVNALFGSKINQENVNNVQGHINALNSYQSNYSDFDSALSNANNISSYAFNRKDIGSDGLFRNKAKKLYNKLQEKQENAVNFANRSVENNVENISGNQMRTALANYAAYGGGLDVDTGTYAPRYPMPLLFAHGGNLADMDKSAMNGYGIDDGVSYANGGQIRVNPNNKGKFTEAAKRAGMSVQEYAAHVLANKDDYSPTLVKRANFARNASKWHAFGGDMLTNGADFSNGYTYIGNGSSHEMNPYEGVQIGVDQQGVPNLVEEGEVVYDDYVFSNRLTVPDDMKGKYKLGKKDITFAQAFKKLSKESDERPNDPISRNGLDAFANDLRASQEEVRKERQDKKLRKAFNALPTEDKAAVINQAVEAQAQAQAQAQGQAIQEQAAQQQMAQQAMMGQAAEGQYAHGGRLGTLFDGEGDTPQYLLMSPWTSHGKTYFSNQLYNPNGNIGQTPLTTAGYNPFIPDNNTTLTAPTLSKPYAYMTPVEKAEQAAQVNNFISEAEKNTGLNLNYGKDRKYNALKAEEKAKNDDNTSYLPTWMRYAPVAGAALGVAQNLFSKPDHTASNAVKSAAEAAAQYDRVRYSPLGTYLTYKPLDRQYAINMLNAQSGATRRNILNTAAGNRGQAMAGLLAADYNAGNKLGTLFRNAEESNRAERQNVATFNRATDQANSDGFLKAAMSNQSARQQAAGQYLTGINQAMALRNATDQQRAASLQANLTNFFDSLGNIGKENYSRNDFNMLAKSGYFGALYSKPQGWTKKEWEEYKKNRDAQVKAAQALRNQGGI